MAKATHEVLPDKTVINIPGCPPNAYNLLSTVLYILTFNKLPDLDGKNRPLFAYGRLVHENCERRAHFDAGRFALEFGDIGHRQGWCLYKLGCKGPETYANCPAIEFYSVTEGQWPVGTGHPCFGCTEQGVGFTKPIHALANVLTVTPPTAFPQVTEEKGQGVTPGAAALAAGVVGAAAGAGAVLASRLGKKSSDAKTFEPSHYTEEPKDSE
jgi:hydrogenase small subunit